MQNELYNFAESQFSRNKKKARLSYQQRIEVSYNIKFIEYLKKKKKIRSIIL